MTSRREPGVQRGHLVGMIRIVLGPILGERLGVTSTHEHLLVDPSHLQKTPVATSTRPTST
jgi:predicted metal-dependent phosphotriesterase family hydrolase